MSRTGVPGFAGAVPAQKVSGFGRLGLQQWGVVLNSGSLQVKISVVIGLRTEKYNPLLGI